MSQPQNSSTQRWNACRDVCAAILLVIAVSLPWSIHFGVGVPNSNGLLFAVLILVTLVSLAAVGLRYAGLQGGRLDRLRLALNAPYLVLVAAFIVFTIVDAVRYGGSTTLPSGVGPGAWFGLAGALLAAQPTITDTAADEQRIAPWNRAVRIAGVVAIVLASLAVVANLYWRTRYVLPGSELPFGSQNVVIIASTLVYGALALTAVVVATRWLLREEESSRLAATMLGASTLLAGFIVWTLPMGREIDAYHGIAENTSTAAVGFEGYLAWVAAAAIFGPLTLRWTTGAAFDRVVWRDAARKGLLLIAIWCGGSAVCRVMDLVVTATLNLPYSPYDSMTLMAFDVIAAVLAIWLRVNLKNTTIPPNVVTALCGVLLAMTFSRIVIGIALAPRLAGADAGDNPVYGNTLAQQLTSTFDVVLCGVALAVLVVALWTGHRNNPAKRVQPERVRTPAAAPAAAAAPSAPAGAPMIHRPAADATTRIPAASDDATQQLTDAVWAAPASSGAPVASAAPRIHRAAGDTTEQIAVPPSDQTQRIDAGAVGAPKIFRPLQESTQRFAAGTTYGGAGGKERISKHRAPEESPDDQ